MRPGRGCRRPEVPPHRVKMPFRMHPASATTQPASVSFEGLGLMPPIKDQGGSGSCEGHACSTATQARAAALGVPLPFTPSELDLYRVAREIDVARSTPIGQLLPALEDNGSQTEDVLLGMSRVGIRPRYVAMTSDGRNSDCETATINDRQTLADVEEDGNRLAVVPPVHAIDPGAADMVTQARAALAALIPVRVDFFCDTAFENWSPAAPPYGEPDTNDPQGGGHAIVCCGYRTEAGGSTSFRLANSWGTAFGDAGYWWVSEAFMRAAWGLTPWDIRILGGF